MKTCKDCKVTKEQKEFYGAQGECKSCTRLRVKKRENLLKLDPIWLEKEQKRQREKYFRLQYKEKHKPTYTNKKLYIARYKSKYPEKYTAKLLSQHLEPVIQSNELHHWSYDEKHAKDVIELNFKDHAKIHRFMKYDIKTFMYKDLNGNLLNTKEKHQMLIDKILKHFD